MAESQTSNSSTAVPSATAGLMQVGPICHLKSLSNDSGTGPQSASGQPSTGPFGRRQLSWAVSHHVAHGSDTLSCYIHWGKSLCRHAYHLANVTSKREDFQTSAFVHAFFQGHILSQVSSQQSGWHTPSYCCYIHTPPSVHDGRGHTDAVCES